MAKRVYVMDCDGFVKIGISQNVDRRKSQIPYDVKQYYCTEPIENAYELERKVHKFFNPVRNKQAEGTEYFLIGFKTAVKAIEQILITEKRRLDFTLESISYVTEITGNNDNFYELIIKTMKLSWGQLYVVSQCIEAMLISDKVDEEFNRLTMN